MLFYHFVDVLKCILAFFLLIWAIVGYTYIVNKRRDANDPKKRDYHPFAIFLAPFTSPFLLLGATAVFVIRALLFAVFIVIFTILLIAVRKPFIFKLWDKFATWIGDPLLKANTYLIRMAFRPWNTNPQPL